MKKLPMQKLMILAGFIGLLPSIALGQTAPTTPPAALAPTAAPDEQVDTSALAYYATRHDTARLNAELRRLRSLYPAWQPPADLSTLTRDSASEDKPLWDLFGADKLDELDAEIAKRKVANPAYTPPAELTALLATKRARGTLIAASDRKDFAAVLDLVAKTPGLVGPDDIEVAWRVADALARTGASEKSLKLDQMILDWTQDPAMRLATVRKAMVSLAPADVEKLLALGKTGPDGRSEFDAVALDLVRQRIGRVLAGSNAEGAAPQDVARLEASARGLGGAGDAALLGWLNSKRQRWAEANTWFALALAAAPAPTQAGPEDAKVAQGAVIALKALGRTAPAEALAYSWREADPALGLLYVDGVIAELTRPKPVAIDQDRLTRFADVVTAQQSGDGAQALGWYAYNIGQFRPAQAWFEKALTWQPRDSTALGLALSLKQLGSKPELAAFLTANGATYPALASISAVRSGGRREAAIPAMRTSSSHDPVAFRNVPARARLGSMPRTREATRCRGRAGLEDVGPQDSETALQTGWCLLALKRPTEAAMAFAAAREGSGTRIDSAYGQALAELRINRTREAVQAASAVGLTPKRRNEIGLVALAQTAAVAFDAGRYEATLAALDQRERFTAEPRDLGMLRAWSTYHLGDKETARTMFSTFDQQLSTSETRQGIGATGETDRK